MEEQTIKASTEQLNRYFVKNGINGDTTSQQPRPCAQSRLHHSFGGSNTVAEGRESRRHTDGLTH